MAECLCNCQMIDYEQLGKEIRSSFSNLLKIQLPVNFLKRIKLQEQIKIISIACGKFVEAECLLDYFSFCKNLKLYGIEIDESLLAKAKERLIDKGDRKNISLKQADASELDNYVEWLNDGSFDMIIVRHPEITFNTNVFMKIFTICYGILNKDACLLITTHLENEKRAVKYLLQMLKFNILVEAENTNAASIEKDGKLAFADKFLLIASST